MDGDVKKLVGFVAPLAIVYFTYSAITAEVLGVSRANIRPISTSAAPSMPKLPSAERTLRDPFVPEGMVGEMVAAAAAGGKEEELRLEGTVVAGNLRFAILNGTRVMEGDFFRGMKLAKVETSHVRLVGGKEETIVPLGIATSDMIKPVESRIADMQPERSVASTRASRGTRETGSSTTTARTARTATGSTQSTGSTGSTGSRSRDGDKR